MFGNVLFRTLFGRAISASAAGRRIIGMRRWQRLLRLIHPRERNLLGESGEHPDGDGHMLDLGTGTGTRLLTSAFLRVVAVEPTEAMRRP